MRDFERYKETQRSEAARREGAAFVPAVMSAQGHLGHKLYMYMRDIKPDDMREPQFQWWVGMLAALAVEGSAAAYANYYARVYKKKTQRRGYGSRIECPL